MKKKIGKITAYTLCVLIVVVVAATWCWTKEVSAASPDNARIVVPLTTTLGATKFTGSGASGGVYKGIY